MQTKSSAATSRNVLPAITRKGVAAGFFQPETLHLDLGAGKYRRLETWARERGVYAYSSDPYNLEPKRNAYAEDIMSSSGGAHTISLSNVLNVIDSDGAKLDLLDKAKGLLREGGSLLITAYEGDRTGEGRATRDGWQENRKLRDYEALVRVVFKSVTTKGGLMVASMGE